MKAESLDPDALVAALKDGHYYSSTGPVIHGITHEDDHLIVECAPAVQVFASGNGSRFHRVRGGDITQAAIPLARFREHGYLRITVVGEDGGRAWTNPIWLDER